MECRPIIIILDMLGVFACQSRAEIISSALDVISFSKLAHRDKIATPGLSDWTASSCDTCPPGS